MIKKTKKIIIFTLLFSMGFAVLLGCCVPGMSYADSIDVKSERSCHSKSSETADSKSCKYDQTTAILDVKGISFLKSKLSLNQFEKNIFLHDYFLSEKVEPLDLFSKYPPQLAFLNQIPLYLEYSVFRV